MARKSSVLLLLLRLVVALCASSDSSERGYSTSYDKMNEMFDNGFHMDGDYIFAGLFAVHSPPRFLKFDDYASVTQSPCLGKFNQYSYEHILAMLFAIERINANQTLLPGIHLGFDIRDTCSSSEQGIRSCLKLRFARKYFPQAIESCEKSSEFGSPFIKEVTKPTKTIFIFGEDADEVLKAIAEVSAIFHVPMVTASSQSITKEKSPYLIRFPSLEQLQASSIADLVRANAWTYITILGSDDHYGRMGVEQLKKEFKTIGNICVDIEAFVRMETADFWFQKASRSTRARVLVLFLSHEYIGQFVKFVLSEKVVQMTVIVSDISFWDESHLTKVGHYLQGMIGVSNSAPNNAGFDEFVQKVLATKSRNNLWAQEYRRLRNLACLLGNNTPCTSQFNRNFLPYGVATVVNIVEDIAHTLHKFLGCNFTSCPGHVSRMRWKEFLLQLQSGHELEAKHNFGASEQVLGMSSLVPVEGHFEFIRIGWSMESKAINFVRPIHWNTEENREQVSLCSKDCATGYTKVMVTDQGSCCWECSKCIPTLSPSNHSQCTSCNDLPDHEFCVSLNARYSQWTGMLSLLIISISGLCFSLVVVTTCVCFWHLNKLVLEPLYRRSFIVENATLWTSICLYFCLPVPLLMKPSKITCVLAPFVAGVSVTLNVGMLLLKRRHSLRRFDYSTGINYQPQLCTSKKRLSALGVITFMEISVCTLCLLLFGSPKPTAANVSGVQYLTCGSGSSVLGLGFLCAYNTGFLLFATYKALARCRLEPSYREDKAIAAAMLWLCLVTVVSFPIFMRTPAHYRQYIACTLSICTGLVEYGLLAIPVLCSLVVHPKENKQLQSSSPRYTNPTYQSNLLEHDSDIRLDGAFDHVRLQITDEELNTYTVPLTPVTHARACNPQVHKSFLSIDKSDGVVQRQSQVIFESGNHTVVIATTLPGTEAIKIRRSSNVEHVERGSTGCHRIAMTDVSSLGTLEKPRSVSTYVISLTKSSSYAGLVSDASDNKDNASISLPSLLK